jgi:hypothetical protein
MSTSNFRKPLDEVLEIMRIRRCSIHKERTLPPNPVSNKRYRRLQNTLEQGLDTGMDIAARKKFVLIFRLSVIGKIFMFFEAHGR